MDILFVSSKIKFIEVDLKILNYYVRLRKSESKNQTRVTRLLQMT